MSKQSLALLGIDYIRPTLHEAVLCIPRASLTEILPLSHEFRLHFDNPVSVKRHLDRLHIAPSGYKYVKVIRYCK